MSTRAHLLAHIVTFVFAHHALAQDSTSPQVPWVDDAHHERGDRDRIDHNESASIAAQSDNGERSSSTATVGRCADHVCPSTDSMEVQYGVFAECLSGPDQRVYLTCTCADLDGDDFVSLRDFAIYQAAPVFLCQRDLVIWQGPGLGFCPQLGTIYRASVYTDHSGRKLLIGSMIAEGDPETDRCLLPGEVSLPLPCYVAVSFPTHLLTPLEWAELSALVNGIPPEGCQHGCDWPCEGECCDAFFRDPCNILHVNQDTSYCYGGGNADEYRQAIQAVAAHVAALVSDEVP